MRRDRDKILTFVRERMAKGDSIYAISKLTPVSHTTIRNWLQGERKLTTVQLKRADEKLRVNARREAGAKLTEIAEKEGISLSTVNRYLSQETKNAIRIKLANDKAWVIEQHARGLTPQQIADLCICNVRYGTIARWIRESKAA